MDIAAIIRELRDEIERIDRLILALDTLHAGPRRGRPPKLLQQLRAASKPSKTPTKKSARKAKKRRKETILKKRHLFSPIDRAFSRFKATYSSIFL